MNFEDFDDTCTSTTPGSRSSNPFLPSHNIVPIKAPPFHQELEQQHQLETVHTTHDTGLPWSSYSYYGLCLLGGGLSSSVRWVLTPIDLVKVNLQAHPNMWPGGVRQGLYEIYMNEGLKGLYRGLTPTILAYAIQSGVKYGTYEYLKRQLWNDDDHDHNDTTNRPGYMSQTAVFMLSAALAEGLADIFMCPWEMLKVKVQTATTAPSSASSSSSSFPTRFGPAFITMVQQRQMFNWPFGALPPLWGRQVIGTVANFVTFEHVASTLYGWILHDHHHRSLSLSPRDSHHHLSLSTQTYITKADLPQMTQLSVTFTAGYISGFVSTIVSHPADTIVSLQARYPTMTVTEIIQRVGWKQLATKGLALRIVQTGTIIASQWLIYDSFKSALGMGTTGGGGVNGK
jgi:solute carrier family 25 (mitochondrial phosphate transporter), member 3